MSTLTTTSPETINATGVSNVINGTQDTFQANDTITATGTSTLSLVDTGTAAWTLPAASVTGVQTISLRNINGVPATPAVTEVVTISYTGLVSDTGATDSTILLENVSDAGDVTVDLPAGLATWTGSDVAIAVAAAINAEAADALYTATVSGASVILTAKEAGEVVAVPTSTTTLEGDASGGISNLVVTTTGADATTTAGATDTIAAGNFAGATLFVNNLSTNQVDITGLTATQGVQINGNGAITNGATNAQYASSSTIAALTVNGGVNGGAVALTSAGGTGIATVSLTSTGVATGTSATAALGANVLGSLGLGGSATALNITANNNMTTGDIGGFTGTAAAITVTGTAGALNLGTLQNTTVKTVNASAFAGGITTTLNTNAAIAFTGGAGNDVVTTGAVLTTGTVNGGTGTGDILVVGNVSHVNTAALAAKYTNFETLRVGGTMDASLISGITRVQLTANGNVLTNVSSAQTVQAFTAGTIGATTITPVSGTANTLNLILGQGTTTTAAASTGVLTLTGYSTVNLSTNAGPTATVGANRTSTITGAIVDANLTTVNLTGTAFTFTDIATTLATTWNGSALTGNGDLTANAITGLTVAGNATAGSSIIGSAVSDSFTLGAATNVTYNGGLGSDLFITTVARLGTGGAAEPTLIGGSGTDTLRISDAAPTLVDANFTSVSGFETLNLSTTTGSISVTGLSTYANAAFASGLTVTSGTLANGSTYNFNGLAYANSITLTLVTDGDLASTADNVTIVTGAAADTVSVTGASIVGAAGAGGTVSISTGGGVDTITLSTGTLRANTNQSVVITAGTGADVINVSTHVNAGSELGNIKFTIAAGDSTTTAYDVITGFDTALGGATISDNLDFTSVGLTAYATQAAGGYTAEQLTVAVSATGVVTFGGTLAATLSLADSIAAVQSVVTANAGDSALFTYATAGVTSTYVFNNNATADSVVQLVGVTGTALITTNGTTAGNIFIS